LLHECNEKSLKTPTFWAFLCQIPTHLVQCDQLLDKKSVLKFREMK